MNGRSLLRLVTCNLLLIGLLSATYAVNNLTIQKSYAAAPALPSQYFAPDVDATTPAGNPFPSVISQAGKVAGTRYYELGFITASKDQCQALWGGMNSLTYMQGDIANLRTSGGDVILNFGGYAAGNPTDPSVDPQQQEELALACPTVSSLQAQYQKVITAYHATHVAFAIEGDALSNPKYSASISLRNMAIAGLKSGVPGMPLCVEFTLTGTTTGFTDQGVVLLKDAIDRGINICVVNILAMNYGSSVPVDQPGAMGQYAIDAAQEAFFQLKFLYPKKTNSQLWSMVGLTIMNGVNSSSGEGGREIFSLADTQTVLQFALKNKMRELSMWELHRDQPPANGNVIAPTDTVTATPTMDSGIQQKPYEFSTAFNMFTSKVACPPPSQLNTPAPFIGIPSLGGSTPVPSGISVPGANTDIIRGLGPAWGSNQIAEVNRNTIADASCPGSPTSTVTPSGPGNPSGPTDISSQNCPTSMHSVISFSNNRFLHLKVAAPVANTPLANGPNAGNSGLSLAISTNGSQFQVGQQVAYTLTACLPALANNTLVFISDTLSIGLANLRTTNPDWQIVYASSFGNGSMTVIALYVGPATIAANSALPPFAFSGTLAAAAVPRLTSIGVVATVAPTSGSLAPLGSSGLLGLSLNAEITDWAAAVNTISVQ
jgi:hypothetical protein